MLNATNPESMLTFAIDGEGEYSIPYPNTLPIGYSKRLKALGDAEDRAGAFMDIFTDVLDRYAPGATDRLSLEAAAQVLQAWVGEGLGES